MHSLCIVANLHIAVNNINLLTVAMGMQEWVTFALVEPKNILYCCQQFLGLHVKCPTLLSDFN